MIVVPTPRASSRTATRAVTADGLTGSPRSSTTNTRSASPSKASPMSAPCAGTAACRSTRLAGSSGLASWLGKEPSSSKYIGTTSRGRPDSTTGTVCPPMPLPASTTTFSGRLPERSTRPRRWSEYSPRTSRLVARPGAVTSRSKTATPSSCCSAQVRISTRPESWPIGAAPARHILMPLYCAGLWLAVNIAPGRSRLPAAKYSMSVDPSPASTTSRPRLSTPSAKARDNGIDESRMSCAVTTAVAPDSACTNSANAAPIARATSSSHWSGTTPRTS